MGMIEQVIYRGETLKINDALKRFHSDMLLAKKIGKNPQYLFSIDNLGYHPLFWWDDSYELDGNTRVDIFQYAKGILDEL